jgi:hypothetical protein
MVNSENVNAREWNAKDNTVAAAYDLTHVITPELWNDLSGIGKVSQPLYGLT